MKMFAACLVALSLCFLGATQASPLWVVENQSDQVYVIDINTLAATLVGPANVGVALGGLGFASDGALYCWTTTSPNGNLYVVDQTTGNFTHVGSSTLFGADTFDISPVTNEAIAWSVDGSLNDVDLTTGAATFRVATSPSKWGVASSFAPDGTLYQLDGNLDQLNAVDIDTGVVTLVGSLLADLTATNVAYNPDDDMLYAIGIFDPTYPLYRIDPTTGAATLVGNITGLPNNPDQQVTMGTFERATQQVIPEPSTLALLGLASLGAAIRRRRRA